MCAQKQHVHGEKRDDGRADGVALLFCQDMVDAGERRDEQRHDCAACIGDAVEDPDADQQHQQRSDQDREVEEAVQHEVDPSLVCSEKRLVIRDAGLQARPVLRALFILPHDRILPP